MKFRTSFAIVLSFAFFTLPQRGESQPPKLKVPDSVIFEPNIEYSNPDGQHLQVDMARPKTGEGPFPAILCIHGGGFRAGSRQGYDGLCIRLAEQGYVALTVSYRLAPKYQFPAAIYDVKAAVRWLRANAKKYNIDPKRIGVTGGSAGGHLAQFLAVTADVKQFEGEGGNLDQSSRVACVVNYFGPSDFTKSYGKSVDAAQVLPLWLGADLEHARLKHIQASPLYWVTPNAAPTLCVHGTEDKYVAHEQAVWIIDRLKAAGVEAELLTLQGAGHGFKGKDAETAEKAMLAFFAKHLKSTPTPNKSEDKETRLERARDGLKSADVEMRRKTLGSLFHSDLSDNLVKEIAALLKDSDGEVRAMAATAIGNHGEAAVPSVPALIAQLKADSKKEARETAARALGRIGKAVKSNREAVEPLRQAAEKDDDPVTRVVALGSLAMMDQDVPGQVTALRKYLHHDDALVRMKACHALGMIGPAAKAAAPEIVMVLEQETDAHRRGYIARSLGLTGDSASLSALYTAIKKETDAGAKGEMRGAISRLGGKAPE